MDTSDEEAAHDAFKRSVRVKAVRRAEGNRRPHGIRTQNSMVKAWDDFTAMALQRNKIQDNIVDEHALLLFIEHSAEREKLTQRGLPIPGTRLGASQLKKLFFGALRIRKPQDAMDPMLAQKRPAATFIVWEAIKNRMDEALERVRNGLDETEDAPDIRANTFLPEVTEEQLQKIGYGFLGHRQLRLSVFGHLAWTAQHASGNRGDDFRALKLAELQPYEMQHPVYDTTFPSVLGLQGEEKAGRRGMRTIVNPSYTVFIAHKNPEMCPFGAFAFYHHYIHDEKNITESLKIDWTRNSSWRGVRILHGPKSPVTPYSDQNLYNLYCRAYTAAGFTSRLKAHLPRHLLGYRQEEQRVDPVHTAKLGWKRNETYFDTYAPALPKQAVLGAAGYKATEEYNPVWRNVAVPAQFLRLICPMAEDIRQTIKDAGKDNLSGANHYWEMVIALRPYAFLCGAAIFQKCPRSSLFRLPAFTDRDVRNWMKNTFPMDLVLLQASAGSAPDIEAIQNTILRHALENFFRVVETQDRTIRELTQTIQRRTAVLSPTQGFSMIARFSSPSSTPLAISSTSQSTPRTPAAPAIVIHLDEQMEETGTYHTPDNAVRAFANSSPKSPGILRAPTGVDLVLPPTEAFFKKGAPRGIVPPLFGQQSARWPDVFERIQQPKFCWAVWGPSKTVDKFGGVREMWTSWIDGEAVVNEAGEQTGKKPPLQLVERYMQAKWRTPDDPKHWGRYREIPEWIERESGRRGVSPDVIIAELEAMRTADGKPKGLNWLRQEVEKLRKQAKKQTVQMASRSFSFYISDWTPFSLGTSCKHIIVVCDGRYRKLFPTKPREDFGALFNHLVSTATRYRLLVAHQRCWFHLSPPMPPPLCRSPRPQVI
ncbi:hypothetical protein K438DRAFT_1716644 [Mycena galopus ATCC 62051]|nr:hypothetical protein K438DRAFT_1716644 [Mycena galopus ATCC 62051]